VRDRPKRSSAAQLEVLQVELLKMWGGPNGASPEEKGQDSVQKRTILHTTHSIEEAVFLGQKVVILSGRPSEVVEVVNIELPEPRREPVYVTFDQSHGNYVVPGERLPIMNWQNFQTFYVWTQRLGLVPRNEPSLDRAVQNSRALVQIQPVRPFSIEEIDRIVDFVRRGGTLVVLDSPENVGSTAPSLLGPFGIELDGEAADSIAVLDAAGDTLGVARSAAGVNKVTPLWRLGDGRIAMGYLPFAKGKVVACAASYLFSSESMGNTAVVPDDRRRRLFRAEYDIFEKVAGLEVRERYYTDLETPAGTGP